MKFVVSQVQGISMHKMPVSKATPSISFSATQSTVGDQIPVNGDTRATNLPYLSSGYVTILYFSFSTPQGFIQYLFLLVWKYINTIKWFLNTVSKKCNQDYPSNTFLHSFPTKFECVLKKKKNGSWACGCMPGIPELER